jgi:hypothetical protein
MDQSKAKKRALDFEDFDMELLNDAEEIVNAEIQKVETRTSCSIQDGDYLPPVKIITASLSPEPAPHSSTVNDLLKCANPSDVLACRSDNDLKVKHFYDLKSS